MRLSSLLVAAFLVGCSSIAIETRRDGTVRPRITTAAYTDEPRGTRYVFSGFLGPLDRGGDVPWLTVNWLAPCVTGKAAIAESAAVYAFPLTGWEERPKFVRGYIIAHSCEEPRIVEGVLEYETTPYQSTKIGFPADPLAGPGIIRVVMAPTAFALDREEVARQLAASERRSERDERPAPDQ